MSYCIVDTATRRKYRFSFRHEENYKTLSAAKAALTRYKKNPHAKVTDTMVIMTEAEYKAQVKMKRVKVLGTENWIDIPEDTPHFCDPSREAYWSM